MNLATRQNYVQTAVGVVLDAVQDHFAQSCTLCAHFPSLNMDLQALEGIFSIIINPEPHPGIYSVHALPVGIMY